MVRGCAGITWPTWSHRFETVARRDEGASRNDVTEEQRRHGPKMGLPAGLGRYWAVPASLIASMFPVCALFTPWLVPQSPPACWPCYSCVAPW